MFKLCLINCAAVLGTAAVASAATCNPSGNATNPIIDLGSAGSYLGVLQNNGTYVASSTCLNLKMQY